MYAHLCFNCTCALLYISISVCACQMKERQEHVRHLDQDVVGLQATQDSLKRTLAMKEKHTQQLVQDNTQLKDSLAALQSKVSNTDTHTGGKLFLNKERNWATFSKSNPVRYIWEFSSFFTSFTVNHPSFFPSSSAFPLLPSLHI